MAGLLNDINAVIYVKSAITHFNGYSSGGGELVRYDETPVGGPPAGDYNTNVRAPLTLTLTTRVPGADAAARLAFINNFPRGAVFAGKAAPGGNGDLGCTGEDVAGRDFTVTSRTINHQFQQNSELTVVLTESGTTAS